MFERASYDFNKAINIETISSETRRFLENYEATTAEAITKNVQRDTREFLRIYLKNLGITVDKRLLLNTAYNDDFEIWSFDKRFLGCSGGFMRISSYSIQELLEQDWGKLFERDPIAEAQLLVGAQKLMEGSTIVDNAVEWHTVRERGSRKITVDVRVKALGLAFHEVTREPSAFVAIVNFKTPNALSN